MKKTALLKYFALLLFIGYIDMSLKSIHLFFCHLLELVFMVSFSNILSNKNRDFGKRLGIGLMLLFNLQLVILFFSGTYLSPVLIHNIYNIRDISGKTSSIALWAIVAVFIAISFFSVELKQYRNTINCLVCVFSFCFLIFTQREYCALYSYINLASKLYDNSKMQITSYENNEDARAIFYKDNIRDEIARPFIVQDKPNIVLIFTEGLSQNIVEDNRHIMPNIAKWQSKSISFSNYFNHTFATFKGIMGQLYSGYQLHDIENNNLVSLQDILRDEGYLSAFINTEPYYDVFSNYIHSMDFELVIEDKGKQYAGSANTLSDEEAYLKLRHTLEEVSETQKPFFISMYTFGTHATLTTSQDKRITDPTVEEILKFKNCDASFGEFMNWFVESEFYKNTIIVFTSDHATYTDLDYRNAFPEIYRYAPSLDAIPFFIFHEGVVPTIIDANGRNSLCLAPTILDYIDISSKNYFLGSSLFSKQEGNELETVYYQLGEMFRTKDGVISEISQTEKEEYLKLIKRYFVAKSIEPDSEETVNEIERIGFLDVEKKEGQIVIRLISGADYEHYTAAVWKESDQSDLKWYDLTNETGNLWETAVRYDDELNKGKLLNVHVYAISNDGEYLFISGNGFRFD